MGDSTTDKLWMCELNKSTGENVALKGSLRAEISFPAAVEQLDAAQPSLEPLQPQEVAANWPDARLREGVMLR